MSPRKLIIGILIFSGLVFIGLSIKSNRHNQINPQLVDRTVIKEPAISPTAVSMPIAKILQNNYHVYQTFNNCGPASLSMALSYYGIHVSQQELGNDLRPYQNAQGNNDDKSVSMDEMGTKAQDYGLTYFFRPAGNVELIKQFLNEGIPVITQTLLTPDDDIGHYRIIKGFNDQTQQFIQDDSFQGPNLKYTYDDFNKIWQPYNYEYLILVPKDKVDIAKKILGNNLDPKTAWQTAKDISLSQLKNNPASVNDQFNISVEDYYLGNYTESVAEYEKVADKLPMRTLWYQIEPIKSYYELGNYQKVFEISDNILNNGNRAFSELYQIRGDSYLKQQKIPEAKAEFENVLKYNKNYKLTTQELTVVNQ